MTPLERLFGDDASILRQRRYQILLTANVNAALASALVSPILESLTGPFAVSEARVGLLLTALMAPTIVFTPLIGVLSDRYSRKTILVWSLVVFGAGGAAIAFTTDFRVALALRVLQGIGFAGIIPIVVTSLGDLYSGSTEATAQGIRFTSTGVTSAVFPILAGILVTAAWQFPFLLYALALPVAVIVYLFYNFPPKTRRQKQTADGQTRVYLAELLKLIRRPHALALLVAILVPGFLSYAFFTYMSFIVVRILGRSPGTAGVVFTIHSSFYAITASQSGRLTQLFSGRIPLLVASYVAFGSGLVMFGLSSSIPMVVMGAGVIGVGKGLIFSILRSLMTVLPPTHLRGGFVSVGESSMRVGSSIAPAFLGFVVAMIQLNLGFATAIRTVVVVTGIVGGLVGICAILVVEWQGDIDESATTDH